MLLKILRQRLTNIQTFFQLRMRDIPSHHDRTTQQQSGRYRILIEVRQNFQHRPIQIDAHCAFVLAMSEVLGNVLQRLCFKMFNKDAVFRDFPLCLTIRAARDTDAYGQRRAMSR